MTIPNPRSQPQPPYPSPLESFTAHTEDAALRRALADHTYNCRVELLERVLGAARKPSGETGVSPVPVVQHV